MASKTAALSPPRRAPRSRGRLAAAVRGHAPQPAAAPARAGRGHAVPVVRPRHDRRRGPGHALAPGRGRAGPAAVDHTRGRPPRRAGLVTRTRARKTAGSRGSPRPRKVARSSSPSAVSATRISRSASARSPTKTAPCSRARPFSSNGSPRAHDDARSPARARHVHFAPQSQLPPLLLRPDHLGQRHLDAATRASGAHPQAHQ